MPLTRALIMTLASALNAATALDDLLKSVKKTTLPNGLTLITKENPGTGVVSVNTWVKAGYFHEPDEVAGMAHLFEHMLFKGSKKFPSAEDMDRALAAVGGRIAPSVPTSGCVWVDPRSRREWRVWPGASPARNTMRRPFGEIDACV